MPRTILTLAILLLTGLAGCADEAGDAPVDVVDPEDVEIESGKGAIEGLLVDDRFRPIIGGTILLQPVGQTTTSNENGEFFFLDLEPGAYTIKVSAEGHEASPQTLNIKEGEFTEANVVARRIVNEAGSILTQEYSVFIPCSTRFVANGIVWDCTADQSGDSYRPGITADYSDIDNVTYMVTEMKGSDEGHYRLQIRPTDWPPRYASETIHEGNYIHILLEVGVPNEEDNFYGDNVAWENDKEFDAILFAGAEFEKEANEQGFCCGAGHRQGIRAQIIQSIFIGAPEVDVTTYCVLC